MKPFTFDDIVQAEERIRPYVPVSPLEESFHLGDSEHRVYFKLESTHRCRSFKIRGAMNKMLTLTEEEKRRGVGAVSSGNHGSAVSYVASLLGIERADIVVPEITPHTKTDRIAYFGGNVVKLGANYDEAHALGLQYIAENGLVNIDSCHDDPYVYAGQGTAGLELMRQLPEVDTILVPVGGGGIATGVALVAKTLRPEVKVYGVQTEACPALVASIRDGVCYSEYPTEPSLCEALVGGVGELSFAMLPGLLDGVLVVKEETVRRATAFMITEEKFVVEAGSAVTVAALWDHPEVWQSSKKTALILTGGNIDGELIRKILA